MSNEENMSTIPDFVLRYRERLAGTLDKTKYYMV